jgi:hypothetical protein
VPILARIPMFAFATFKVTTMKEVTSILAFTSALGALLVSVPQSHEGILSLVGFGVIMSILSVAWRPNQ